MGGDRDGPLSFLPTRLKKNHKYMEGIRERKIYVRIQDGYFERQALPEDDLTSDQMVTRERRDGTRYDVWRFSWIEGCIRAISVGGQEIKGKVYDTLYVTIAMAGEERTLRLWLDSDPARDILDRMPHISPDQIVTINLGHDRIKERDFIWITSGTDNIPKYYNATTPHDKPEWEQKEINGQTVWDKTAQIRWYKRKVDEWNRKINHKTLI